MYLEIRHQVLKKYSKLFHVPSEYMESCQKILEMALQEMEEKINPGKTFFTTCHPHQLDRIYENNFNKKLSKNKFV